MYFTQKQIARFGYNFAQRNFKKIPKKQKPRVAVQTFKKLFLCKKSKKYEFYIKLLQKCLQIA